MFVCFLNRLLELPAGFRTLFWRSILGLQPSPLEVESIFTRQNRCFLNWSCHIFLCLISFYTCKDTHNFRNGKILD